MAELVKISDNSGIWRIKPKRRKDQSENVVCSLTTLGYYGDAKGSHKQGFLEGDILFEVNKKNYHRTEISTSEGVNLGALEWSIDAFKNISWGRGGVSCILKGFRPYLIMKRVDSLSDPYCNKYYEFMENNRKIASTTIDFHSFLKFNIPPPRFDVSAREDDDPNPWLIAMILMYIYSIDGHYQVKSM